MSGNNSLEALEGRQLFAGYASLTKGVLRAVGDTNSANTITVDYDTATKQYKVNINGVESDFDASKVGRVIVHGGELADTLSITEAVAKKQTIFGYGGNDIITGMARTGEGAWSRLWGMDGNDKITEIGSGMGYLDGGAGDDSITGGDGGDLIAGNIGNDIVNGALGNDTILGGDGSDTLYGGLGNDLLNGGKGINTLLGEGGDDTLDATQGTIGLLLGGDGVDTLLGSTGLDTLVGGAGDDVFTKGSILNTVIQDTTPLLDTQLSGLLNLKLSVGLGS